MLAAANCRAALALFGRADEYWKRETRRTRLGATAHVLRCNSCVAPFKFCLFFSVLSSDFSGTRLFYVEQNRWQITFSRAANSGQSRVWISRDLTRTRPRLSRISWRFRLHKTNYSHLELHNSVSTSRMTPFIKLYPFLCKFNSRRLDTALYLRLTFIVAQKIWSNALVFAM